MAATDIVRLAHALALAAASLCLATLRSDQAGGDPHPSVVFLAQGPADPYFDRFATALRERHPQLFAGMRLQALAVPDDEAGFAQALRAEAATGPRLFVAQNGYQAQFLRTVLRAPALVFSSQSDPRKLGVVSGLAEHPEPSTGIWINDELDVKRLELLLDAFPSLKVAAVLGDTDWFAGLGPALDGMQKVAREHGVTLRLFHADSVAEALQLLEEPRAAQAEGWCLPRTQLSLDARIARRLVDMGKPVVAGHTPDVYEAAQLSYAQDRNFVAPALADLVARILQGEPPASIPIQIPQRFQLAVRVSDDPRLPRISSEVVRRADLVIR